MKKLPRFSAVWFSLSLLLSVCGFLLLQGDGENVIPARAYSPADSSVSSPPDTRAETTSVTYQTNADPITTTITSETAPSTSITAVQTTQAAETAPSATTVNSIAAKAAATTTTVKPTATAPATVVPNAPPMRNVGTATELRGRCLIFDVYLSDDATSFSDAEKRAESGYEAAALGYLSDAAKANGVSLTLIYGKADTQYDYAVDGSIFDSISNYIWASTVYSDVKDKYGLGQVSAAYAADSVAVYLHVNKAAGSYTLYSTDSYNYPQELSVIFTGIKSASGAVKPSGAFVYAHELLHQFGAIDLYRPYHPDDPRVKMAANAFPGDLMRIYTYNLSAATLSDIDMYLIGWYDTVTAGDAAYLDAPYN